MLWCAPKYQCEAIIITSVCFAQNAQVTLHLCRQLTPFVDSVAIANRKVCVVTVTCFSGRLQCDDVIKRLLVTRLSNTLFNLYCWFFFNFYCWFTLNSVETVANCVPLRLSMIYHQCSMFSKVDALVLNKHPFDGNCSNQLSSK